MLCPLDPPGLILKNTQVCCLKGRWVMEVSGAIRAWVVRHRVHRERTRVSVGGLGRGHAFGRPLAYDPSLVTPPSSPNRRELYLYIFVEIEVCCFVVPLS